MTGEKNERPQAAYSGRHHGQLLAVVVHAANIHDTKSGINPAKRAFEKYPTTQKFCGDDGYRKSFEEDVSSQLGLGVDISKRTKPVFEVIPKRSVVERTFSCLNHSIRLPKDRGFFSRPWREALAGDGIELIVPFKRQRNSPPLTPEQEESIRHLSSIRQPIECLFAFFNRVTHLLHASLARSANGLLAFLWGKICFALLRLPLYLNP